MLHGRDINLNWCHHCIIKSTQEKESITLARQFVAHYYITNVIMGSQLHTRNFTTPTVHIYSTAG